MKKNTNTVRPAYNWLSGCRGGVKIGTGTNGIVPGSRRKMSTQILERALEKASGESIENLRFRTLEETRVIAEKKHGFVARFVSYFPFIGRGNVLRDRLVSHDEVEKRLEEALRDE